MLNNKRKMVMIGVIVAILTFCVHVTFAVKYEKLTAAFNDIKVYLNGTEQILTDSNGNKVEPFIIDGTVYLPARAVSELLGLTVRWDKERSSVYLDDNILISQYSLEPDSFLRIFLTAKADKMLSFMRIGSDENNYAEIIFDLVLNGSDAPWVRINANAVTLRNPDNLSYNMGILEGVYAYLSGDHVTYLYYSDATEGTEDPTPVGYIQFFRLPNGNIWVEEFGDVGFGLGVSLAGEYEFGGLG